MKNLEYQSRILDSRWYPMFFDRNSKIFKFWLIIRDFQLIFQDFWLKNLEYQSRILDSQRCSKFFKFLTQDFWLVFQDFWLKNLEYQSRILDSQRCSKFFNQYSKMFKFWFIIQDSQLNFQDFQPIIQNFRLINLAGWWLIFKDFWSIFQDYQNVVDIPRFSIGFSIEKLCLSPIFQDFHLVFQDYQHVFDIRRFLIDNPRFSIDKPGLLSIFQDYQNMLDIPRFLINIPRFSTNNLRFSTLANCAINQKSRNLM